MCRDSLFHPVLVIVCVIITGLKCQKMRNVIHLINNNVSNKVSWFQKYSRQIEFYQNITYINILYARINVMYRKIIKFILYSLKLYEISALIWICSGYVSWPCDVRKGIWLVEKCATCSRLRVPFYYSDRHIVASHDRQTCLWWRRNSYVLY